MKTYEYKPKCAVWESTLACNLTCIHCGGSANKKRIKELNTKESFKLMNMLKDIGTEEVAMMGGEPFLRKDWFEIAKYAKKIGLEVCIISNGLLIDEAIVKKVKKINPRRVGISLDGSMPQIHDYIRNKPGAFNKVLNALELLKNAKISVSIITTILKPNLYDLYNIAKLIKKYQLNWQVQMATCNGMRMSKKEMITPLEFYFVGACLAEIQALYHNEDYFIFGADDFGYYSKYLPPLQKNHQNWLGCKAGKSVIGIQSNGEIKGCLSVYNDLYTEGNIFDEPLTDIWNNEERFCLNRNFKKEYLEGFCKDCEYGEVCQAGCSDVAQNSTGSAYNNPYCYHRIEAHNIA